MCAGANALLNGPDGPFNFANMTVGGDNIESDGKEGVSDALKFVVSVNIADGETARGIGVYDVGEAGKHGIAAPVGDGEHCAVAEVTRDGVKEGDLLDVEEIGTKSDVAMVFKDGGRDRHGVKSGDAGRGRAVRG